MADPFKILSAGDAVKAGDGPFNAQWHNAVSDATRKSMREAVPSTAPVRPIDIARDSEIWIANVSETNVDQFTAVGLGQLAIPPDDAGDFRERLCFLSAPFAAGQPFGIVQDPIGPGELYVCKTASGPGGQPPRSGWIRVKGDAAAWSSATTYAIGQQVAYDGDTWIAKAASTNQAPASGSYWQIAGAHRGIWDRDEAYAPSDVVLLPQLGRVHIAGVSRAYLNVRNTEHAYAGIESGELVSQRAPGPLAILWRGGIGSNWAVVRFCCDDTLTTPDVTGTGALDLGAIVPAATCTYLYTPGGAPEFGAVTVAGTGTYTPPAFTGSGALALGAAESAGVSLAYDVPPSGRLNLGVLTADGEGEVTTPPRGRSRLRLGAFEAAGTGAVTFPAFTGSGAMTLGAVFVEHAHAHINRVVSINGGTKEQQFIAVDSAAAGADLNVTAAATAYDSLKVYYQGQVATSAGSTYRYINATPGDGVLLSNTSYWEDITGKGLIVINVPQGSFTALSGDFTHNAKPGETIVVSTVGGTAGNSIINLPADTDSNAYGYETGRPGAEVVIKYVEWDAGTYLKITGACIYDSGDANPYQPLTIYGDSGYTPGADFLEPSAMVFRWTQSYSHAPVCRWILAASHNLVREDGLHAGRIYYTRPPGASATTAGLTFRRGFYAGGTLSITKADVGLGNVDNTSDVNKPVSTAQQAAIDAGESYSAENKEGFTILAGMACAVHSSGTGIIKASSADNTKIAIGLIRADTANTFSGLVQKSGLFTLSDWTSVIGASTLAAKTTYFLDPSTPGKLTATVPTTTGQTVQIVGTAVSTTTLDLDVGVPILL